ncbi:MAG: mannonate dehydratase [Bryobacterales bacterium]|nr:mannonate dehydratase [Bryobacterales bacterium]
MREDDAMRVTRRDLGNAALAGAAMRLAPAAAQQQSRWNPLVPGTQAPEAKERMDRPDTKPLQLAPADPFAPDAGIGIGHRFPPQPEQEVFDFYRASGIEYGSVLARLGEVNYDWMARMKERMEERGVRLLNVNVVGLHCDPVIVLGLSGVEEKLELYRQFLRDAGKAGIPYTTYGHMANLRLRYGVTARVPTRGQRARQFDANVATSFPLSHDRSYSEDEIWSSFTRFAKAVVPVAEDAGVRIGLHPDDPPLPTLGGVARVFRNYEGYRRALEITDSPNFGYCFCMGTWAEGGERTGKSVIEMIREFAPQGKIFKVHFRNVDQPMPRFTETFVDDGYIDMIQALRELRKANFNGVIVPDHVPGMRPMGDSNTAYTVGYMRALRDVVNREFAEG